jgi:arylformamidase
MILDITRPLSPELPSWPGDPAFDVSRASSLSRGDAADVSRVVMSAHAGTHLDAPSHVLAGGGALRTMALDLLVGPARVIRIAGDAPIGADSLAIAWREAGGLGGSAPGDLRILIRTESAETTGELPASFASLRPDAAAWLIEAGVRLVGIDTPSVDAPGDAGLPVHRILARAGAAILEWLDLRKAAPGLYTLAALPLRLDDCEAAPVRAILLDSGFPS